MHTFRHYHLATHLMRKAGRDIYLAYSANEPDHGVVLKIFDAKCLLPVVSPRDVQRLSQRLQLLKHPSIVALRELGIEQGKPYAVSEYLAAGSLRLYLSQHAFERLAIDEAIKIGLQVGQAVAFAHSQGIVHQHIRPENVMLNAQSDMLLTDFSLGAIIDETQTEPALGGPATSYIAPEQLAGVVSPASDQYALGCLLYELITGTPPFQTDDQTLSRQSSVLKIPVPPTMLVPTLSHRVETVLLRALEMSPRKRYGDVTMFLAELKVAASRPASPAFPFAHLAAGSPHEKAKAVDRVEAQTEVVFTSAAEEIVPVRSTHSEAKIDGSTEILVPIPDQEEDLAQQQTTPELQVDFVQQETKPDAQKVSAGFWVDDLVEDDTHPRQFGDEHALGALTQSDAAGAVLPASAQASLASSSVPTVNRRTSSTLVPGKQKPWSLLVLAVILVLIATMLSQGFNTGMIEAVNRVPTLTATSAPTTISFSQAPLSSPTSIALTSTSVAKPMPKPTAKPKSTLHPTAVPAQAPQSTRPPVVVAQPTATPKPTPTVAVDVPASYEAESSLNTRTTNIKEFTCPLCSGGLRIGWINGGDDLRFNDVTSIHTRSYTLLVYYYNSIPNRVTALYIGVNNNANIEMNGLQVSTTDCCNYAPYIATMSITLQAGTNSILLSNPNGPAPDIDRIVVKPA